MFLIENMKGKDMNKNILFIATIPGFLNAFMHNNFKILNNLGYEIHVATNLNVESKRKFPPYIIKHHIDIRRTPFSIKNYNAYKQLIKLVKENDIDIIDCHTPVGGVLGRLTTHKTKRYCIYTAHGFHFFKGAPIQNWLIFYPIEKWLSKYTDILITINKEDYQRAKSKFHMKQLEYIPGVGIDVEKFQLKDFDRDGYRKQLGYTKDDFVIISVGDLSKRKNHEVVLRAIAKLNNPNIKYMIVGQGNLKEYLINLSKELHIENQFQLLGFRKDIPELLNSSDLFCFPSLQEGLPVALMEALASGMPCIASDIRGNNDLINEKKYLFEINVEEIKTKIADILSKEYAADTTILKEISSEKIMNSMSEIYKSIS